MDSRSEQPTQELHGRESLAPVFENLNTYQVTTHFNGQSTVVLDGDRAPASRTASLITCTKPTVSAP